MCYMLCRDHKVTFDRKHKMKGIINAALDTNLQFDF